MKKLWLLVYKPVLAVIVWVLLLGAFAYYRIDRFGVNPQFPYYNILITKVQRPAEAVWAFFDGAHFVRLAEFGYVDVGTQAFFPLYPLLIRGMHQLTHLPIILSGQLVSILSLAGAAIVLNYLFPKRGRQILFWLLVFPTSFFFAAVYTESLFLFLSLLCLALLQRRHFLMAAMVAGLASATRLVGGFLAAAVLWEYFQFYRSLPDKRRRGWRLIVASAGLGVLSLSGLLFFMWFLYYRFGDPLMFLHVQTLFGAERSSDRMILLPQVLYRYGRMILTVDQGSWLYQRIWLELAIFLGAVYLWFRNLRKLPLSWTVYTGLSLLLPTLTGTLSSVPRYVLAFLPFLVPVDLRFAKAWLWALLAFGMLVYLWWVFSGGFFVA